MPGLFWMLAALGLAAAAFAFLQRARAHATTARGLAAELAEPIPQLREPLSTDEEPLLLTEEWSPPAPQLRWRWAAAIGVMLAPGVALLLSGPTADALMWLTAIATAACIIAAEMRWPPAAWPAAIGATAWAFTALFALRPEPDDVMLAVFFTALGVGGLAHMRRNALAGLALLCGMIGAAFTASLLLGAATPYGAALAAIIIAAAVAGAIERALEGALAAAWIAGCLGLYALSGQSHAETWLTPAAILMAALFLAIASVALPARGAEALLPAATGAVAAPFAIGVLAEMHVGPSGDIFEAFAYFAVAVAQACIVYIAARRQGGLEHLGLAIAPPGLAFAACLVLALTAWLNILWAIAPLTAGAAAMALLDARARHGLWNLLAIILLSVALFYAWRIAAMLSAGIEGNDALTFALAGFAAPAVLAGVGAWLHGLRAPWTAAVFEAAALALAAIAFAACVRWVATQGAPHIRFVGFAEAGVHITIWIGFACALLLRENQGAFFVRRAAACAFGALGAAVFILGPASYLNPWWGALPTPATGAPLFNFLLLGYAAPALGFAALAAIAARRSWRRTYLAGVALAALSGGCWLALELRRAFRGADLAAIDIVDATSITLSAAGLVLAVGLRLSRLRFDTTERTLAAALAAALCVKLGFIDLAMASGDARALSLVLLALAGAALALPRNEPLRVQAPSSP